MRRWGFWLWLACAAPAASAQDDVVARLNAANVRSTEETATLAQQYLAHPEKLDPVARATAHAYLCESLTELDRADEALADGAAALAGDTPTAHDTIEPTARLLACTGFLKKQKGLFADALADFNRALAPLDSGTMWLTQSYVLYRRAGLYDTLGGHAEALADLTQALQLLGGHENDADVRAQHANIASAIARIHLHRQEYQRALPYYTELLSYSESTGDEHAVAVVEINLGECLRGLNRWDEADKAYARVLDIGERTQNATLIGRARAGRGAIATARGRFAAALKEFDAARTAFAASSDRVDALGANLDRAEALDSMRDWKALDRATDELIAQLGSGGDARRLRRAHELAARAAEGMGDLAAALAHERAAARLQREIEQRERADELGKRSVQFEVARLADKANLLQRENQLAQLTLAHEHDVNTLQRVAIGVAAALVLLLVLGLLRYRRTGKLLHRLAHEDALTGLDNRRATLAAAERAFAQARAGQRALALALLDIDHFKRINDRFGHAVGDDVLVAVGACLRRLLRHGDVCGRVGGEEFLLLLPDADAASAFATLERVRAAVGALRIAALGDERVTLSAGVVQRRDDDADLDALVRRADAALYAAKNAGRDRSVSG